MQVICRPLMIANALLIAGLASPLFAEKPAQEAILGKWEVVSAEQGGNPTDKPVGDKVEFTKDKMIVTEKDDRNETPEVSYVVDVTKSPWAIDLSLELNGATLSMEGILAVEDKQLKFCMARPGAPRPSKFESDADSKSISMVLKPLK